jgi:hypothetical protein
MKITHNPIIKSPLDVIPSRSQRATDTNIFIAKKEKDNACIICLDEDDLIKNNKCSCNYYFHQACVNKLPKPNQCLLCKKNTQPHDSNDNDLCSYIACYIIFIVIILSVLFIGIMSI